MTITGGMTVLLVNVAWHSNALIFLWPYKVAGTLRVPCHSRAEKNRTGCRFTLFFYHWPYLQRYRLAIAQDLYWIGSIGW